MSHSPKSVVKQQDVISPTILTVSHLAAVYLKTIPPHLLNSAAAKTKSLLVFAPHTPKPIALFCRFHTLRY